jgi:hypothetical protein
MDKNDFIKLVNLLVDKKLKEILPGMIESEIKRHLESGIEPDEEDYAADDDLKNLIPYNTNKSPIIRDNSNKRGKQTESKSWSKNPIINKILDETAKNFTGVPKDPSDPYSGGSYQQLLSEQYENVSDEFSFNTKNMANIVNRNPVAPGKPAVNNLKNELLQEPGAQPEIVNAMVKDYSKLLKKIDKTAKAKRGGGLPLRNGVGEDW